MTGPILARVRRVMTGHSERALVHAVDDAGLEYKIEVPVDAVQDAGRDRVLLIMWSLHTMPGAVEPSLPAPSDERPPSTAPGAADVVDQEFMALMARGRRDAPAPVSTRTTEVTAPATSAAPVQQIAALLGIQPTRPG